VAALLAGCDSSDSGKTETGGLPAGLNGTYTRSLTKADLDRTAARRTEGAAETPPFGRYTLTLQPATLTVNDPGSVGVAEELTVSDGVFNLEKYRTKDAFCPKIKGAHYSYKLDSDVLTLTAQNDACADRDAILSGHWKRSP
jgi:hypothetical protein